MFKSGYVTVIGRPNVGKSTLLNRIMSAPIAIVSDKPQTTRTNMKAIYNDDESQIIFVDTPGMHKPKHKLGEYMVNKIQEAAMEVDIIIFITEPSEEVGPGDNYILNMIKEKKSRKFLVVNKMDQFSPELMAKTLTNYSSLVDFDEIIPISAAKGKNVDVFVDLMKKHLPEGPKYYPDDIMADVQEKFLVSEKIREKALRLLDKEIPHGIAVNINKMTERENGLMDIEADIVTEKDSHKGIIIGKNGEMLKKIGTYAREDLEAFFGNRINLKLFVKVRKDWRDKENLLSEFGYKKGR